MPAAPVSDKPHDRFAESALRILLVSLTFKHAGASLALLRIARLLRAAGHEVAMLAMEQPRGALRPAIEAEGFEIVGQVRHGRHDLAICNTVASAKAVPAIAGSCPVIWWLREAEIGALALKRFPKWSAAFGAAARIVVQSGYARDTVYGPWFAATGTRDKAVVLPNGIEVPETPVMPPPGQRRRIVGFGPAGTVKRTTDLIAAAERLRRDDLEVVLVGDMSQLPEDTRATIAARPQAYELTGELSREAAYGRILDADALALTSMSESQSNVAAEAGFALTPMATSDLPTVQGFGWRHNESCLVHPVGDVEALAANLARLLDEPALGPRLAAKARVIAEAGYGLEAFRSRLLELVEEVRR